jgi:isocitrate/isopropylmalate dehydrogenase
MHWRASRTQIREAPSRVAGGGDSPVSAGGQSSQATLGAGPPAEPIHGPAPTLAGQGIANPLATVWAGAMMLEHLGEVEAAKLVFDAVKHVAKHGPRTKDLGGTARTAEVGEEVAAAVGITVGGA